MKFQKYSDRKKALQHRMLKEQLAINENYIQAIDNLIDDFAKVKKVIKNTTVTALEVWLEVGIKAGTITEKQAQTLLAAQDESLNEEEEGEHHPIKEADEDDELVLGDEVKPDGKIDDAELEVFNAEIEKALTLVLKDIIPADLKVIADGGELDLAPSVDKEADSELNEAIGAIIAGGALALPAITQIVGKTISWAGSKLDSKNVEAFGKATEKLGHDLHKKYEQIIDKILSPLTKHLDPKKRQIANKVVFYSIIAVLGGAGIAGAIKAAGAGQAGLAAVEGGLSSVKASELVSAAEAIIPRILSKLFQTAEIL